MMAGMRLVAGRFGPDELLIRSAFWSSEPNLCIGADLCRRKPRGIDQDRRRRVDYPIRL